MDSMQNAEDMSADDMDSMYELIAQKGIDVVDDANDDLDLEPEAVSEADEINEAELANMSVPEGVSIDDPVRMYLKEIGRVLFWLAKTKLSLPTHGQGQTGLQAAARYKARRGCASIYR